MAALSNPLQRVFWCCGMFVHKNHAAGGGNGSVMVGMFVCMCLASQKPSEREFFVSARTDLSVKLLKIILMLQKYPKYKKIDETAVNHPSDWARNTS